MKYDHFGVLGFPWDGGASLGRPGARYAPKKVREIFGWFKNREEDRMVYLVDERRTVPFHTDKIVDYGDVDIIVPSTSETFENAERQAREIIDKGGFPMVIGGDHSISFPIIKALHDSCQGQVGIIQFDAHLDLVDESKLQGKYSQSSQMRRALELDRVNPDNIVQIGVRGANYPWYDDYLKSTGIHQYTSYEIHEGKPRDIAKEVVDLYRKNGVEKIYLTFDIDVLDPAFAPATGADEPFGLNPHQCKVMLQEFYPIVDAFDIAEVNPLYEVNDQTMALSARLMFDCFVSKFK
ncbi:formiminoglutamase [Dethiosulfatibacter aminovorans DSM 17477]|uniref:Formiminoglutamase n=1 Tax=Dethiosulfatibacter aminovorans DSM 17477 TaxID=1121476 RepID=A0A1M6HV52_9FIRM|nr:agmatinase family protein [Dethiosulfatibacter aminovorans]SHJ26004.1 formiminoglutamase [Dethiosulfatibacter aminovorans DSM 17477]